MAEFESWDEYGVFAHFVKYKSRYVLDERSREFLRVVLKTGEKRMTILSQEVRLWRAQIGHDWRIVSIPPYMQEESSGLIEYQAPHPYGAQRMRPLADRATEGRVNPKGIPCLYCSMDRETAMSEVRPWIGSHISVAQFTTVQPLQLVDCSLDDPGLALNYHTGCKEPSGSERESAVWGHMNLAFSEPVSRSDDIADYAPTQVIAEAFRDGGYGGMIYESRLGEGGKNVAIFSLDSAKFVSCGLFRVDEIRLTFTPVGEG